MKYLKTYKDFNLNENISWLGKTQEHNDDITKIVFGQSSYSRGMVKQTKPQILPSAELYLNSANAKISRVLPSSDTQERDVEFNIIKPISSSDLRKLKYLY